MKYLLVTFYIESFEVSALRYPEVAAVTKKFNIRNTLILCFKLGHVILGGFLFTFDSTAFILRCSSVRKTTRVQSRVTFNTGADVSEQGKLYNPISINFSIHFDFRNIYKYIF